MFAFLKLKTALSLGYITTQAFLDEINRLAAKTTSPHNTIILKLNSLKYQITAIRPFESIPLALVESVLDLFGQIERADLTTKTKAILTLLTCDSLSHVIGHESGMFLGEIQLREILRSPIPPTERHERAKPFLQWEDRFHKLLDKTYETAESLNDNILKAQVLSVRVLNCLEHQINVLSFQVPPTDESIKLLLINIQFGNTAYSYFVAGGAYKDGYNVLCNTIDLIELAVQHYHIEIPEPKELYNVKAEMESNLEVKPKDLFFPKTLRKIKEQAAASPHEGMPDLENLTDDQIHSVAITIHSAMGLPAKHLLHIEAELKAYRTFHQRCKDPNIEIRHMPLPNQYAQPVQFILRNTSTSIETIASDDMNKLLTACGH
jgi:hypothetical protein